MSYQINLFTITCDLSFLSNDTVFCCNCAQAPLYHGTIWIDFNNSHTLNFQEAMSINKSLSALGDVISALSSEQQFIPYRNNKLTMLMQDSLGGNAKTLMFVNVSPADYNGDESVISLTLVSCLSLFNMDVSLWMEWNMYLLTLLQYDHLLF